MLLDSFTLLDLTHLLSPSAPTWNGSCGFCLEVKQGYDKIFCVQQIKMHAGVGTHMDAPSHRFEEGISIEKIPLDQLLVRACVLDVSTKSHADYVISTEDIYQHEKLYGKIPEKALVIGYTGWSKFWKDPHLYRNLDTQGQMHFPAFSKQSAELLLQRNIAGLGIDTLSPDCLDLDFPVHKLLLGSGKYIIENMADCSKIPPQGAYILTLPLNIENATECPVRIIALIPKK